LKKVKSIAAKIASHTIWLSVILSFLINFTIEACARHGVLGSLIFLVKSPIVFFYNTLIILATMSIVALFRRRIFMFTMVSAIWLGLGIANGIILANRMTPFTIYDLQSLKDGLSLATNYMTKMQIAMLIAGGIILVVGIVLLWKKAPKKGFSREFLAYFALFLKDTAEVGLDALMDFLEDPEAEEFVMEWNQEVFEEGKVGLEEGEFYPYPRY